VSRVPDAVAAAVLERAGGCCECCGTPVLVPAFHHRRARGMGGHTVDLDTAYNILALDPQHHAWWHEHPTLARTYGVIVGNYRDPATVPVRRSLWTTDTTTRWARLTG
jgi:hypothetical protein